MKLGCVMVLDENDLIKQCRNVPIEDVDISMIRLLSGEVNMRLIHSADIIIYTSKGKHKILQSRYFRS